MISRISQWLDDRTGIRQAIHEVLYQRLPGGARWRYVWGTTLMFAVVVQFITGIFLWMHYSPGTQTAWESVCYIEFQMLGGQFLRGIHHYMSSAVMILLALHVLQVVIYGAYRAPREVNYWIGLAMMLVLFGLGQTGYLLPWDQRGYYATQVATNIAGVTPVVGDQVRAVALGGSDFGHHTLTRFFALHAGVLPGLLIVLMIAHISIGRRHGLTPPEDADKKPDGVYWPNQALRDALVCLAVMSIVVFITFMRRAELGPPSDPTVEFNTARPEWYFRFLYQSLKLFKGETGMFIAAQLIPGLAMLVMVFMPFVGKWKMGRRFNTGFVVAVLLGIVTMTVISYHEDFNGTTKESLHHIHDVALAEAEAHRAQELALLGVPVDGSRNQTRRDPMIAGRRLFKAHCASCHSHHDPDIENPYDGHPLMTVVTEEPSAANLYAFGSRRWMQGILDYDQISGPHYFGKTVMAEGDMVSEVEGTIRDARAELDGDKQKAFDKNVESMVIALSAQAKLPYQQEADRKDQPRIDEGIQLAIDEFACTGCHTLGDEEGGSGPDLTGYASHEWLKSFISNPQTERFYYNADNYDAEKLMPGFAAHAGDPRLNKLTDQELELIVRWLRRDWPLVETDASAADESP